MTDASKPPEPEQTEPAEQSEQAQQPESEAQPAQAEPTQEGKKPKMSKLAVLSIVCLVAAFAILVIYLRSSEAWLPIAVERLLIPIGIAALAIALVTGVIALVMIKASGGALSGRRLAILGIIVPIVVVVAFVRSSSGSECCSVEEPQVPLGRQYMEGIRRLGIGLLTCVQANEGRLPAAEKWCDILLEQTKAEDSLFACPLQEGARCSYSLNKYAAEAGSDLSEDIVLLFESAPGWNQVGGPELMITPHGTRRGITAGCVLLGNGKERFVSEDELDILKWKP